MKMLESKKTKRNSGKNKFKRKRQARPDPRNEVLLGD
jgi:hypothetical protein